MPFFEDDDDELLEEDPDDDVQDPLDEEESYFISLFLSSFGVEAAFMISSIV